MAENKLCEVCTPLLFGSSKAAAYHRKALNIENFALNCVQKAEDANAKRCNVINVVDDAVKVDLGRETPESDEAAMLALQVALDCLDRQEINVLVAAPQGYASLKTSGFHNFLAKRYDTRNAMSLLVGEKMKVGFVTDCISLKEAVGGVTFNAVFNRLRLLDACLKKDFTIRKPRIAVLGMNPYMGENGLYGDEEKNIIIPAIEKARNAGIMALGPFSSDTLFGGMEYGKFDAVLAMYHEQGTIPFKIIEGNSGAVLMAGLPIVCTSTAHGMAYDIIGKGIADESGMRNALYLAIDVYNNRRMNAELEANPLKHYNISSNANESDLNVEQIEGVEEDPEE